MSKEKIESRKKVLGRRGQGRSAETLSANRNRQSAETVTAGRSKNSSNLIPCDGIAETKEIANHLLGLTYYHGMMPRDEVEDLLKNDGDFLVRKTDVVHVTRLSVSVVHSKRIRHILLNYINGQWTVRIARKATVPELIEHHIKEKIPVQSDGTILQTPIPRPDFYILHDDIVLGDKVGSGAFGAVHKGTLKKNGQMIDVAVKQLKGAVSKKNRAGFIKEAKIMHLFHHRNVVRIYGIAPQDDPLMIVLELCPGGCLRKYIMKHKDITQKQLISYSKDAVRGLCYLALRRVIHRDIAARNCLLGKDDDVKISDFGLSCLGAKFTIQKGSKVPVKWLAPEVFKDGVFTTKTDVWAFGIMMWEIFSRCATEPFPKDTNKTAKAKICSGNPPMEPPAEAPDNLKEVMLKCWIQNPEDRPSFEEVFNMLCPEESVPIEDDVALLKDMEELKNVEPSQYFIGMNNF